MKTIRKLLLRIINYPTKRYWVETTQNKLIVTADQLNISMALKLLNNPSDVWTTDRRV